MNTLPLSGCSPTPLVNYLKALGTLRILAEQAPELEIRGSWRDEEFILTGNVDRTTLCTFFLDRYSPSAIVAPWNGGSGFHPNDNKTAIEAISKGIAEKFALFRKVINVADAALTQLDLKEKPPPEIKETLLKLCRNTFPDDALGWLDAAFVLTQDGVRYPPLLGTGGNDGRLDFTNNFMQRLTEIFDPETGEPQERADRLLGNSLFGEVVSGLSDNAIGQFGPAAAGGANASSGFTAKALVNPWDFVLMLEGAMLFAAASVKRLGSSQSGQLVYPFSVRTTGTGYGSASGADEADSRCEMWMPLWKSPASFREIRSLLSEGRAQIGMRPARDGLDFYRAITAIGVDRGIDAFQRYGFLVRNGLAYFATPMERVAVRFNSDASDLLSDLDKNDWLDRFRQKALGDNAPGSVTRACRHLQRAIIGLCTASQEARLAALQVKELLVALGRCELAMANSLDWTKEAHLNPVPPLSPVWLSTAESAAHGTEYRLAAALASLRLTAHFDENSHPFRAHVEPVEIRGGWANWSKLESRDVIGLEGDLLERMNAIIHRRILLSATGKEKGWQELSAVTAHLTDIAAFIEGNCDDHLLKDLLAGLCLINWAHPKIADHRPPAPVADFNPDAYYALLKLCHARPIDEDAPTVLLDGSIHRLAASGQADRAAHLAIRRLRSSGIRTGLTELNGLIGPTRRTAAALLFPLWPNQLRQLERIIHTRTPEAAGSVSTSSESIESL